MNAGLPDPVEERASEGAAFTAVTQPSRRTPVAIAVAAIAVLAIAFLTKQAAPAPGVSAADVSPRPTPAGAVTSSVGPAVAPAASPTSGAPSRNPTVTPHPTLVAVAPEAGPIQLIPAGGTSVQLTISLPDDGWAKASDAVYVKANGAAPAGMSISAWHLQHVNIFPCRWSSQEFADPPLMRTAQGQAQALSDWWGQDPRQGQHGNSTIAPLATVPLRSTVQGFPAWYVEVLIPSYLDSSQCDGGQVVLWDTATGDVRYGLGPREQNRLWVVDVNGEVIVIDAASILPTPSDDVAELQAVVDSVVIEP